jgi:Ferritin-like
MTGDQIASAGASAGGQGRLAAVIATRGGLAAPEAPFVIEHREALIYMLCEAAELEHGIMCQYLFAAFSLKQAADEGLSETELAATTRWRKQVSHVAAQEMLHLALVQNMLSAIGAAPHLVRPNLPAPASHYPAGVQLALLPFGEQALRHFMFLERPEGMDLDDADGLAAIGRAAPLVSERDIVPRGQDFATIGHLYRSIEAGFAHLAELHGEDWLFVGPPRAQATAGHFGWPELVAVTGLASARRAIDEILEQGEGPRGHWRDAHFGQFVSILDEYQQLTGSSPEFAPVRPVMAANVRPPERDADVPLTRRRPSRGPSPRRLARRAGWSSRVPAFGAAARTGRAPRPLHALRAKGFTNRHQCDASVCRRPRRRSSRRPRSPSSRRSGLRAAPPRASAGRRAASSAIDGQASAA